MCFDIKSNCFEQMAKYSHHVLLIISKGKATFVWKWQLIIRDTVGLICTHSSSFLMLVDFSINHHKGIDNNKSWGRHTIMKELYLNLPSVSYSLEFLPIAGLACFSKRICRTVHNHEKAVWFYINLSLVSYNLVLNLRISSYRTCRIAKKSWKGFTSVHKSLIGKLWFSSGLVSFFNWTYSVSSFARIHWFGSVSN